MKFSELKEVRVKLDKKGTEEFWKVINEFGGVKQFSKAFNTSSSKMYNWKSKNSYLPIELVKKVFGNEGSAYVEAYKGEGRSKPVKNPVFPIPENNELLTRIKYSVTVNNKGIPLYQTTEKELIERFQQLLTELGQVAYKVYERDIYELRYPKYLHEILIQIEFEENINAKVDEIGTIENKVTVENEEINPERINKLYNKEKRMKLALLKQDNKEIAKIMSEEKEKVRKALEQA